MTFTAAPRTRAAWLNHFDFTRTPFSKSVATTELFSRKPHEEAVARILHCIQESALGVITGEVGAGTSAPRPKMLAGAGLA